MANKVFKLRNNRVITFIEDERHDFVVSVSDMIELYGFDIDTSAFQSESLIISRDGIDYFTGAGFLRFEEEEYNPRYGGVVEQIMKWIGGNCQFDDLVLPDPDLVRADHGFNFFSEDVIDMSEWEREMLLLIIEVDNLDLRRKLVTKIKEVL